MKGKEVHPYLDGNFQPTDTTFPLTPCSYEGTIPIDLAGGQYIRNGANPSVRSKNNPHRDSHWFDGDGMLHGVLLRRVTGRTGRMRVQPEYVNRYISTDIYEFNKSCNGKNNGRQWLAAPVLFSVTALIKSSFSVLDLIATLSAVVRTFVLIALSHLPRFPSIKRISVANTSVVYHDGQALATCESGLPVRFLLPGLETVGFVDRQYPINYKPTRSAVANYLLPDFIKETTTAHPKVDPISKELIAFHSTLCAPFVEYSVVQAAKGSFPTKTTLLEAVPGIGAPKMMHDFGVSHRHTVVMDLPLGIDPLGPLRGTSFLHYDPTAMSRFGIFPRYDPKSVQWLETGPCLIFHTANCWDEPTSEKEQREPIVNLVVCRMTSASLLYNAGNIVIPAHLTPAIDAEEEQCRLYYYRFDVRNARIQHQWALSSIPFEFPTVSPRMEMENARFVYGCSTTGKFSLVSGTASKFNCLVKANVASLITVGLSKPPTSITGCVDNRSVPELCAEGRSNDSIQIFELPSGWFAQEPRFVPRLDGEAEDDGWLLTYVFDESQLDDCGKCKDDAMSELWIIDAKDMRNLVCRIALPQRVPYGLHGNWFSEEAILKQKPFNDILASPNHP